MATLLQSMQYDNDFTKCFLKNEELPKANKKSKEAFKSKPYQTLPKIMSKKKKPYLIHFERKLSQLQASENERDVHNLPCKNIHASENERNFEKDDFQLH